MRICSSTEYLEKVAKPNINTASFMSEEKDATKHSVLNQTLQNCRYSKCFMRQVLIFKTPKLENGELQRR